MDLIKNTMRYVAVGIPTVASIMFFFLFLFMLSEGEEAVSNPPLFIFLVVLNLFLSALNVGVVLTQVKYVYLEGKRIEKRYGRSDNDIDTLLG